MTISADFRLTQYASGGGCACKIPPGELEQVVAHMLAAPVAPGAPALQRIDADLLIGVENGDDAAVVRISNGQAIVATADFFGPVVDDAYTFGRIAGTNALSDIYAVGGTPLVALNLLGWPRAKLPPELAGEVLRGGLDAARGAGCLVAGGHSIDDLAQRPAQASARAPSSPAASRTRRQSCNDWAEKFTGIAAKA